MIHTILILGHAGAGVVALVFACVVLKPPASGHSVLFRIYYTALLTMFLLVVAVVAFDWAELNVGQRVTFSLLTALGAYTVLRGIQAQRAFRQRPSGWRTRYVDRVGFTVISLFEGFVIVSAVDLGAPLPVVLVVGALGVVVGIAAINRVKSRLPALPANIVPADGSSDTAIDVRAGQ